MTSVGIFSSQNTTAYTPPSTKFAAECSSSIPFALIQTAISIAGVRAAKSEGEERREALAEIDGYIAQVER